MNAQNFAVERAGEQASKQADEEVDTGMDTKAAAAFAGAAMQTAARPDILPAWTLPKTDWRKTDVFDLVPDYARIRGNLLHLRAWAARLYLPLSLAEMQLHDMHYVPDASFFSAVDGNTDTLLNGTFRPVGTGKARSYVANGPVWSDGDLNRIESAHAKLSDIFAAQENGRTALKFIMGGGAFGACI